MNIVDQSIFDSMFYTRFRVKINSIVPIRTNIQFFMNITTLSFAVRNNIKAEIERKFARDV